PEQAMGEREISPRADVYALGCVLYECLSGEPPFTGPTAQAIIARVMTEQPRGLQLQRRTIPAHVEAAVVTALEKLPADRFPSAAAFSEALGNPAYALSGAALAHAPASLTRGGGRPWDPRSWSIPTYVFAAGALVFAAVAGWLYARGRTTPATPLPVVAFQAIDSVPGRLHPAVSSTGAVAWVQSEGIHIRLPGATAPILLPGTERAMTQVLDFSPDGEWLVFAVAPQTRSPSARIAVLRIAASGGVPQAVTGDLSGHAGSGLQSATWAEDGYIYLGASDIPARLGSLLRVPESGGIVDTLLAVNMNFVAPNALLPGNRNLLISLVGPVGEPRVLALDLESRDTAMVLPGASSAHWSPTGHILAARHDGALVALPFDPGSMRALGAPIPVADSVVAENIRSMFSVARNGTLAYVRGPSNVTATGDLRLALIDVAGAIEYLPLPPTDHWDGSFSPDGRRLAYIRRDHVWVYDLDVGTHRQLTTEGANHHNPIWSPDGRRVAFRSDRPGQPLGVIYARQFEGDTASVRLGGTAGGSNPAQWLPDNTILYSTEGLAADVMRLRLDSGQTGLPVLNADWSERSAQVSPDGRWIAYISMEDGTNRVNVRRWPDLSRKVVVSEVTTANSFPIWSRDGRILYVQEGTQVAAISLEAGEAGVRATGRRVVLEDVRGFVTAIHPDGRRLLHFSRGLDTRNQATVTPRLIVISNWHEVLRKRLGTAR
ncbi:MAG TPA: hypothetical protein VFZ56_12980, partial [Gemmatimonadaceae bacterium]